MLLLCVLVWRLFGFVNFLAALVFCVLTFFPLMIIVFTRRKLYTEDEMTEQFRRHHGCEHAMLQLLKPEHKGAFIGGHMLKIDTPYIQSEAADHWDIAAHHPVKYNYNLEKLDFLENVLGTSVHS